MLALKNKVGIVEGSVPGLADMARLTLDETVAALTVLLSPDPYSRSKEFEGRRIREVAGGWLVINHDKWRNQMNADQRREYFRIKQREHRAKIKRQRFVNKRQQKSTLSTHTYTDTDSSVSVPPVCDNSVLKVQTHLERENLSVSLDDAAEAIVDFGTKNKARPSSLDQVIAYAKDIGVSRSDAEGFFDTQIAGGWKRNGIPIRDWRASLRTWKRYGYLASQKKRPDHSIKEEKFRDV